MVETVIITVCLFSHLFLRLFFKLCDYNFFVKYVLNVYGVSAGKRDQIEIFFKKKFLSKIDVDLIIWSRTFIISKKIFLSIWSLFPALTPYFRFYSHITMLRFEKDLINKNDNFPILSRNNILQMPAFIL